MVSYKSFKPYYKWITFNTEAVKKLAKPIIEVLNLIINGLPSILKRIEFKLEEELINLVLNLIINGLPSIPKIF